jgi:hypothetical protein
MTDDPFAYETYHGLRGRTGPGILMCLLFVIFGLAVRMPLGLRIADLLLFGGAGTLLLVNGLSNRVALRADAEGVTLSAPLLRYRAAATFVPWASIERIVLWEQRQVRGGPMPFVGLVGRADAAPQRGRLARINAHFSPPIPDGSTYLAVRAVTGWHLDVPRLTAAVARYAPTVRIQA